VSAVISLGQSSDEAARDVPPPERLTRLVVGLAFATAAALPVVTVLTHLNEFGDGAFFTLLATSDHPWATFWHNYPARGTSFVVSGLLPHLALLATGSTRAAVLTYQLAWAAVPLLSLLACTRILRSSDRRMLLYPAAWFCGVGLTLYGFPSEVWLLQGLAWPLVLAITTWRTPSAARVAVVWLLSVAFAFSHEMMVFAAPVLVVAALIGARRRGRLADWRLWPVVVAPVAAVALAHLVPPGDPVVAAAVSQNTSELLEIHTLIPGFVALLIGVVVVAGTVHLAGRVLPPTSRRTVLVLRAAALVLVTAVALNVEVAGRDRYVSRTAVALALAIVIALSLTDAYARRADPAAETGPAVDRVAVLRQFVAWCALPMLAVQLCVGARFVLAWVDLRAQFADQTTSTAPPAGSDAADGLASIETEKIPATAFSHGMAWSLPYQSILASDGHPHWLLRSEDTPYAPFNCSHAGDFGRLPHQATTLLTRYVCALRP